MTLATGEAAVLTTEGADFGELLDRIDAVPFQRQFKSVGPVVLARNYRLEPAARAPGAPVLMILASARARFGGLELSVRPSTVEGYPAEIELSPQPDQPHDLPDDLLAALGWDWSALRRRGTGWIGSLRAPGREPERSKRIEATLEAGVAHLTRTFAEPPRRFHERFVRARWLVFIRRMTPALALAALLAGCIALAFADIPSDTPLARFLMALPGFMFYGMFAFRELPRLEFRRRRVLPARPHGFPLGRAVRPNTSCVFRRRRETIESIWPGDSLRSRTDLSRFGCDMRRCALVSTNAGVACLRRRRRVRPGLAV